MHHTTICPLSIYSITRHLLHENWNAGGLNAALISYVISSLMTVRKLNFWRTSMWCVRPNEHSIKIIKFLNNYNCNQIVSHPCHFYINLVRWPASSRLRWLCPVAIKPITIPSATIDIWILKHDSGWIQQLPVPVLPLSLIIQLSNVFFTVSVIRIS